MKKVKLSGNWKGYIDINSRHQAEQVLKQINVPFNLAYHIVLEPAKNGKKEKLFNEITYFCNHSNCNVAYYCDVTKSLQICGPNGRIDGTPEEKRHYIPLID